MTELLDDRSLIWRVHATDGNTEVETVFANPWTARAYCDACEAIGWNYEVAFTVVGVWMALA